jgi:phosphoesterase RecJ-like protein
MNAPAPCAAFARDLAAQVQPGHRVLLTGPVDPDGDSIGACLALQVGLERKTGATVVVAGEPGKRYAWLPRAGEMAPDDALGGEWDLVIVLDGDRFRLEAGAEAAFHRASTRAIVDHHRSTTLDGYELALVQAHAASTCELVHGVLEAWGVPLDRDLAALLYTGLVFDTGGFRHSNTTPDTLRLAARLLEQGIDHTVINLRVLAERDPAGLQLLGDVIDRARFYGGGRVSIASIPQETMRRLGANAQDIEGIVDTLLHTRGVEVSCLLIEKPDGRVKLSLRSRALVDVADVAASLRTGGGGHARAAGALLPGPLDAVWDIVPAALVAAADAAGV